MYPLLWFWQFSISLNSLWFLVGFWLLDSFLYFSCMSISESLNYDSEIERTLQKLRKQNNTTPTSTMAKPSGRTRYWGTMLCFVSMDPLQVSKGWSFKLTTSKSTLLLFKWFNRLCNSIDFLIRILVGILQIFWRFVILSSKLE